MNTMLALKFGLSILAARFFRLFVRLGLPMTILAVALGRWVGPTPDHRSPSRWSPLVVEPSPSDYAGRRGAAGRRFLDPATGRPVPIALREGGRPQDLAWSPWRDERGVQALATLREPDGGETSLIRFLVSDGATLDRIPLSDLPNWWGPPCWFPGGSPRALLAGVDGRLHRLDFAGDGTSGPRSRPLAWRLPPGSPWPDHLGDLHGSTAPSMNRWLLASASDPPSPGGPAAGDGRRLWRLRLDDATSIVAADPLGEPSAAGAEAVVERHPIVGTDPEGRTWLAYLERSAVAPGRAWRLRLARIDFDEAAGAPIVRRASTVTLADDASSTAPAFVADGRQVAYVPAYESAEAASVRRVAVPADREGGRAISGHVSASFPPARGAPGLGRRHQFEDPDRS